MRSSAPEAVRIESRTISDSNRRRFIRQSRAFPGSTFSPRARGKSTVISTGGRREDCR